MLHLRPYTAILFWHNIGSSTSKLQTWRKKILQKLTKEPYQYGGNAELNLLGISYNLWISLYSVQHDQWQYHCAEMETADQEDIPDSIYLRDTRDHYPS